MTDVTISGTHLLHGDRDRVWQALRDPDVLAQAIPGCQQVEAVGAAEYRVRVRSRVAATDGVYDGRITSSDPQPRVRASGSEAAGGDVVASCTLRAAASGDPGSVDATVVLRLDDRGDGNTEVHYDADAVVGGAVAGVGQRVLAGVAQRNTAAFFAAVDGWLAGETASADPGVAAPGREAMERASVLPPPAHPGNGRVTYIPGARPTKVSHPQHLLLAALAGAALALLGVAFAGRRRS